MSEVINLLKNRREVILLEIYSLMKEDRDIQSAIDKIESLKLLVTKTPEQKLNKKILLQVLKDSPKPLLVKEIGEVLNLKGIKLSRSSVSAMLTFLKKKELIMHKDHMWSYMPHPIGIEHEQPIK